jgi:3D (Asp-Asp-Asp) domain-containing protein
MMNSSAKSTVEKTLSVLRLGGKFLLIVTLIAATDALTADAQEGSQSVVSPSVIADSDSIRSIRDTYATNSEASEPVKAAEDVPVPESIEPRMIVKTFMASAYCLKGQTASGITTRRGIIAADPSILPLGSVVRIQAGPYSGIYTVMDTGGAIRGQRIDVFFPSRAEAMKFGRRPVKVEVLRHGWEPDLEAIGTK